MKFVGLLCCMRIVGAVLYRFNVLFVFVCQFSFLFMLGEITYSRKVCRRCVTLDVMPEGLVSPEGQLHLCTRNQRVSQRSSMCCKFGLVRIALV
jgi:hypothetical protein